MNLDRVIAVRNTKTVYRDGDKCIKVFDQSYSKADVLNEALNQARVEETGLNIPKVLEVTPVGEKWAIVYEFIKGKTLAQLMEEQPEKKAEYIDLLVDLQLTVQEKTIPTLTKLKDKMTRKIAVTELPATTRYDLFNRLEEMPKHNKLCHGDFNPSNIIMTEDGVPYILDWAHATKGNASADAARTYFLFRLNEDEEGAEMYLEKFAEKTGTETKYIKKWMPLVAASHSLKGTEREREIMLSWVNAFDHE